MSMIKITILRKLSKSKISEKIVILKTKRPRIFEVFLFITLYYFKFYLLATIEYTKGILLPNFSIINLFFSTSFIPSKILYGE